MFTKTTLMDLFKKNEKRNFRIYTNIAVGRGINGVDYRSFMGDNYDSDRRKIVNICSIKGFGKNYLVIDYKGEDGKYYYCDVPKEIYIPYDAIVMVDFVTDETNNFYGFTGKHNFTEL